MSLPSEASPCTGQSNSAGRHNAHHWLNPARIVVGRGSVDRQTLQRTSQERVCARVSRSDRFYVVVESVWRVSS